MSDIESGTEDTIIVDPLTIEAESFRIIDSEAQPNEFEVDEWPVVRRIVHTTGDFDFIDTTRIAAGAIDSAIKAIHEGAAVYCDTNMVMSGVNKKRLADFGCSLHCHVSDRLVAERAKAKGITRSIEAVRIGVEEGCRIFLIGNAPTALFELLNQANKGAVEPALIVGVPVGFVGAAESKDALARSPYQHITSVGRKGGSAIAAAVMNALMILAEEK